MVNFVGLIAFTAIFLGLSFVVRNIVLKQEFDLMNELIILVTTVALIWIAGKITSRVAGQKGLSVST